MYINCILKNPILNFLIFCFSLQIYSQKLIIHGNISILEKHSFCQLFCKYNILIIKYKIYQKKANLPNIIHDKTKNFSPKTD